MRVRLFSMLLMFAILFGGLVAPETAHADNLLAGHSVEVLDKHDHADDGNQEDPGQKGIIIAAWRWLQTLNPPH